MKLRLAEPRALVDINRIPDLAHIREDAKSLRIGATTRTNDLNDSEVIHARYPILSDAAYEIADPLVRNMGTVGGNVSHGDPANVVPGTKGTIESAGLALTAVGPTALKATEAERHLVGKAPDDAAFERAAELAQEITSPVSDLRGPAEYKRAMVRVLTLRALHRASARARGGA